MLLAASRISPPKLEGLIGLRSSTRPPSLPSSLTSSPILIQNLPSIPSISESKSVLPPGLVLPPHDLPSIQDSYPTYDPSQLTVVGPPNPSSKSYNNAQTLEVMNRIPRIQDLPLFIYLRDHETGKLIRYLAQDERDLKYYNTDPDYGISQEWLLNTRQGDEYDRLPERIPFPYIADQERFEISGVTTLDRGRIWYGAPRMKIYPPSESYQEYERLIDYAKTQIEEQSY